MSLLWSLREPHPVRSNADCGYRFNRHKPAELEDEQWLKVLRYVAVKVRGRQRIGQDALNANLGLQTLPAVLELPTDGTKSLEKWAYAASRSSQGPGSTSTASATRASHTLDPETTEKEPWLAIPLQDPMVKFAVSIPIRHPQRPFHFH